MLKKFGVLLLLISFLSVGNFVFAQDGDEETVDEPAESTPPAKKAVADEKKKEAQEKGEKKGKKSKTGKKEGKKERKGKKHAKKDKKAKKEPAKKEASNEEG